MMPASTNAAGQALGSPDVCKTPTAAGPVPVPYPNIGMLPQTVLTAMRTTIMMRNVVTIVSQVPTSTGDEGGSAGGVVSGIFKGPVLFRRGSSKVIVEGAPAVYLTAMTAHNGVNANVPVGQVVVPSQMKVLVAM